MKVNMTIDKHALNNPSTVTWARNSLTEPDSLDLLDDRAKALIAHYDSLIPGLDLVSFYLKIVEILNKPHENKILRTDEPIKITDVDQRFVASCWINAPEVMEIISAYNTLKSFDADSEVFGQNGYLSGDSTHFRSKFVQAFKNSKMWREKAIGVLTLLNSQAKLGFRSNDLAWEHCPLTLLNVSYFKRVWLSLVSPNDKTTADAMAALTEILKTKDPTWIANASNEPLTSAANMQHAEDPFTTFLQEKMHTPNMYELVQRLAHSGLPFYRLEWQRDRGYGELIKIFKCLTTKFTRNPSAMDKPTNKLKANVKRAQQVKRGSSGGLMSGSTTYSFSGSYASNTVASSSLNASSANASTREPYQVTDPVLLEELWAPDLTLDLECLKANNLEYSYDSSAFNSVLLHRVTKYFSELLLKQNLRLAFLKEQIAYSKMTSLTPVTIRGKGKNNVTKSVNENTAPNINENAACRIIRNVTENVTKNVTKNVTDNVTENTTDNISDNADKCANASAFESTNSKETRGVDTIFCLMASSDQKASLNVEAEAISAPKISKTSRHASPLIVKAWSVYNPLAPILKSDYLFFNSNHTVYEMACGLALRTNMGLNVAILICSKFYEQHVVTKGLTKTQKTNPEHIIRRRFFRMFKSVAELEACYRTFAQNSFIYMQYLIPLTLANILAPFVIPRLNNQCRVIQMTKHNRAVTLDFIKNKCCHGTELNYADKIAISSALSFLALEEADLKGEYYIFTPTGFDPVYLMVALQNLLDNHGVTLEEIECHPPQTEDLDFSMIKSLKNAELQLVANAPKEVPPKNKPLPEDFKAKASEVEPRATASSSNKGVALPYNPQKLSVALEHLLHFYGFKPYQIKDCLKGKIFEKVVRIYCEDMGGKNLSFMVRSDFKQSFLIPTNYVKKLETMDLALPLKTNRRLKGNSQTVSCMNECEALCQKYEIKLK